MIKNYFYNEIYVNFATFSYFTEAELSARLQPTEVHCFYSYEEQRITSFIADFIINGSFTDANGIHFKQKLRLCFSQEKLPHAILVSFRNTTCFRIDTDWCLIPEYANYLYKTTKESKEKVIEKLYLECNNKYILR